jgi:DMSO/TMAO reductase YedYZ molybdopterin-dependent catalytic subunit
MERPKRSKEKVFDPALVTRILEVKGAVNHPLRLTAEELGAMELTEVRDVNMICGSGRSEGFIESYRGVRLTEVLNRADVIMRVHDSPNYLYVTAMSSDGRWALFSYQELFNTSVGEQVIVIIEKNGQPLGDDEGKIALISANDTRSGQRKMRYLKSVEVHEHLWNEGSESRAE